LVAQITNDAMEEVQQGTRVAPTAFPTSKTIPSDYRHLPSLSYGRKETGNWLIQGENLRVLGDLSRVLVGSVHCIYIDPPYNNQERYTHYDDQRGHAAWLDMMTDRLEAMWPLLRQDGSLWISIDDREMHYLKVAADEIFGRRNFVSTMVWEQRTTRENRRAFSNNHEYVLLYAKNPSDFKRTRNKLPPGADQLARYRNPDSDARGPWQSVSANVQNGHATEAQYYEIVAPGGRRHLPPEGRCWVYAEARMRAEIQAGNVWFGPTGEGVPRLKRFLDNHHRGLTPETLWTAQEVGTTDEAKKQLLAMFPGQEVFETPKPEGLIARILRIATNPGDLVLDAFLGSGTTSAVAHKLRRRHIGIELGRHAVTHCAERLRHVIDGDSTGISAEVAWGGGGGYDFYRAPIS
jgi:adenine-specific DNA-methyltransferase